MFIFPILYITFFAIALSAVVRGHADKFLLFVVFALPVYVTSLSVTFMYGFRSFVPVLQAFKETLVAAALISVLISRRARIREHPTDWLIIAYVLYNALYVVLPLGSFSFTEKLISFKGICFFPFVYFIGRLADPRRIDISRYFVFVCVVIIAAAAVLGFELFTGRNLQTMTGYADYNLYYFDVEPAGNYGLTWTFEAANGLRRFASFFSMPLEHAAATLVALSVIIAQTVRKGNRFRPDNFHVVAFVCTLFCVLFAFSRASFASYFIMLYAYAWLNRNRPLLAVFHWGLAIVVVAGLIWIQGDVYDFILSTIDFTDTSSVSHLLEWVTGIQSIATHPLGLGLGYSGRIAGALQENIGGEDQLIIIGVQTGLIPLALYIWIYVAVIRNAGRLFIGAPTAKARKLGLMLVLLKVGLIIPLLTSEAESYVYISYFVWFFSGLTINLVAQRIPASSIFQKAPTIDPRLSPM